MTNNYCYYSHKPISTLESLSKHLGIPLNMLMTCMENVEACYKANRPIIKANGSIRTTYRVLAPLSIIQKKIKATLLEKVHYPDYLQGSLKKRSPVTNCEKHLGAENIIKEDVANFFDSISYERVTILWKHLFNFPDVVAECLAKLTTFRGSVRQGSSVSPYIANLILWENEPQVVQALAAEGMVYTRYVDDITQSSKHALSKSQKTHCINQIYRMLRSNGLIPNRSKHKIIAKHECLSINNLNINAGRPTISKKYRKKIRAAIREYEISPEGPIKQKQFTSLVGRLGYVQKSHPTFSRKCKITLRMKTCHE